jgi:hypothetical protein
MRYGGLYRVAEFLTIARNEIWSIFWQENNRAARNPGHQLQLQPTNITAHFPSDSL